MFFCFFSCSMKNTAYEKNSIISYFIAGSSFLFRLEGSLLFVIKLKIDGGTFNAMPASTDLATNDGAVVGSGWAYSETFELAPYSRSRVACRVVS